MASNNIKFTLLVASLFIATTLSFKLTSRIIGGQDSDTGRFPYYVALFNYETSKHICGGAIIDEWHILTAAHCVYPYRHRPDVIGVSYGTTRPGVDRAFNHARNITIPSTFDMDAMHNDIAILKTSDKIKFTKYIQPIPIAKSSVAAAGGVEATLCGFGLTNITTIGEKVHEVPATILQYIKINTLSKSQCIEKYEQYHYEDSSEWERAKRILDGNVFCTANKIHCGPCFGDSGGPLVVDGSLVGVASASVGCALGYPEIYTNVRHYHGWIMKNIKATDSMRQKMFNN